MTQRNELLETLQRYAEQATARPLSLGEVADGLGSSAFSLLCIILSLPFLAPISLGPLAMLGGLTLAAVGWQLIRGHEAPVLPERARAVEMSAKVWGALLSTCARIVNFCQRFSRPRRLDWVEGRRGASLRGWLILANGLLMAVPLFGMPFNNALPALAIIVICLAELEDDGLMLWAGIGLSGLAAVYILGVLAVIALFGMQAIQHLL